MRIFITPEDIVKRCLYDSWAYYVVGSEKEAEKLLKENKEFELSERDAIVIGLLKVMETDNLIHRFNDYLTHFLTVRAIKEKETFLIRKRSIEMSIEKFLEKFPESWEADILYKRGLEDLKRYITDLNKNLEKLDVTKHNIQNIPYEFYNANNIKKLLNFNNY
jgi:hypothetical protein